MDWQVAYLKAAHAPITAENLRFLNAWQRFEGGATNNDAANNYLNTTWGTGFKSINKVGVKAYPSLQVGAEAFANTLAGNRNYGGLLQGLRAGDPYRLGSRVAAGLETWVSGSPTGNPGYANKILGTHATPDAASSVPGSTETPPQPLDVSQPDLASTAFLNVGKQPTDQLANLVAAVAAGASSSPVPPPAATSTPTPPKPEAFKPGDPIPASYQTSVGGEHPTEGLPGYPAHDYFAKAGSPVVAPVSGTVVRLSGHNPKQGPTEGPHGPFGWSVYIKGTDGRTYYLTHLGSRTVKVGDKLAAGTVIGTVGNYARYGTPSHVHQGVNA